MKALLPILILALGAGCASLGMGRDDEPSVDPEAADINYRLGVGYMQQGHYEVALGKLKKSLDYDGGSARTHNAIAVLYEQTGELDLAEQHFKRAVELDPEFFVAKMNYARVVCANGQPAAGEKLFLSLPGQANIESPAAAYAGAGVCARRIPDPARAEAHFRHALEIEPGNPGLLYQLAGVSHEQGEHLQARAFLQRFHERADYSPQSLELGIRIEEALGGADLRRRYARVLREKFADSTEARRLQD